MRYWIGVASRDHVLCGIQGGFCQLGHGKAQPLARMAVGDWIIYYSPKESLAGATPCQSFSAIAEVTGDSSYAFEMAPGFTPQRRDVRYCAANDAPIRPLLERLSFIKDKGHWGYAFRFGHLEITRADFELIATAMLGRAPPHGGVRRPAVRSGRTD